MALLFPNNPVNGQVAIVGNRSYTYNASKVSWESSAFNPDAITPGTYGSDAEYPVITVNSNGNITEVTTAPALSQASAIAFAIALG
jgi:hypothetical protein